MYNVLTKYTNDVISSCVFGIVVDLINNLIMLLVYFFFGGYDTIATQSSLIVHHLAVNLEIQKRLQKEIDELLEQTQGQVTYNAIPEMEYLDAVVNKSLRIRPMPTILDIICVKNFELLPALPEKKPRTLSKRERTCGFQFIRSITIPQRWEEDYKFRSFGMVHRICIANKLALTEIKILMFHLFCSLCFQVLLKNEYTIGTR
ncbi:cytochrome P450 9e2-like [Ptiloglossa arizonensis]|uniref:cytochrome P450 9e2-like n=1 Tax=Ptiloglossa arizonensis TaxID=3350558 RepID=UPI003F9F4878